jgi:signal transduction histidine kinase
MFEFLDLFNNARDLAPHGYCLLWDPALVWTHVLADGLIAGAYFSIPVAILRFVRGRQDIAFSWIFWLFALFILACGTTHLMAIWTLWNPDYHWEAVIKVITAIASVGTAIVLWPLIPKALAIPSPLQLKEANSQLSERVRERDSALEQLKREIVDRERAEAALAQAQKMEAVGQLTGGIAHDFNNLLTVVIGGLDMVQRSTAEPRTKRLASSALEAAERGAKLTGQLLAFSRTQRLRLEPTIPGPLIENMRELLSHTLGPAVQLELQLDEAAVPVLADSNQLELTVLNLAINARDAMPLGGTLSISTRSRLVSGDAELKDGEYLELRVSDTGTGMPAEVIAKAFDPFFTTKEVGKGTGLGLSMVYGVARQSGGTARIESEEGRGTTVSVLLPRTCAAAPSDASSAPARSAPYGKLKILVVDDEPAVRQVLVDGLVEEGHDVSSASDGPEGLEHLRREQFDLLIVDFAMPLMNGAEVVKAARLIRPGQRVLFVTGYSDTAAIEDAAGDAPVVRKPFRPAEIAAAIGAAMETRKKG